VLDEIGAGDIPELRVFNKADVSTDAPLLVAEHPGAVAISALSGTGIEGLLAVLSGRLRALEHVIELVVPFERGDVLAGLHREGEVLVESPEEGGMRIRARLDGPTAGRYKEFVIAS
jgi:GTP-binding protein HflX